MCDRPPLMKQYQWLDFGTPCLCEDVDENKQIFASKISRGIATISRPDREESMANEGKKSHEFNMLFIMLDALQDKIIERRHNSHNIAYALLWNARVIADLSNRLLHITLDWKIGFKIH